MNNLAHVVLKENVKDLLKWLRRRLRETERYMREKVKEGDLGEATAAKGCAEAYDFTILQVEHQFRVTLARKVKP